MKEFEFDVRLAATIRIKAENELVAEQAIHSLEFKIDNRASSLPPKVTVRSASISIDDEGGPVLLEADND